jgi:Polyketide cyclase / dehydrase and lipid transport
VSKNQVLVNCTPGQVFAVLTDGWSYAAWVVGAARIRDVDANWPEEGSKLHHSVGSWPFLLDDTTTVERYEENKVIVLRARAWPGGEATVVIEAEPAPGGTHVVMYEDAVTGPAKLIPPMVRHPMLAWRNTETLRRLKLLAEGRAHADTHETASS